MLSQGDSLIDEVLEERRRGREKRNMLLERARNTINKFEGKTDYFYLDTKGNISTAQGANVDNYDAFMGLDSYIGNRLSNVSEREATYNLLKNKKRKGEYGQSYKAKYYEDLSPLRIKQETIDRLLNTHLENDINSLQKTFPEFDDFPLPLQEVLTDIHYNTGNVSQTNWPNLHQGIKTKNLSLIAKHVHRKDVQKERNDWALKRIKSISKW